MSRRIIGAFECMINIYNARQDQQEWGLQLNWDHLALAGWTFCFKKKLNWDPLWAFAIQVVGSLLSCHVAPHGIITFCFQIFKKVKMTTTLDWWSHIWITLHASIHVWTHSYKTYNLGDEYKDFIHEKTTWCFTFTFTFHYLLLFTSKYIGLRKTEFHWVLQGG